MVLPRHLLLHAVPLAPLPLKCALAMGELVGERGECRGFEALVPWLAVAILKAANTPDGWTEAGMQEEIADLEPQ